MRYSVQGSSIEAVGRTTDSLSSYSTLHGQRQQQQYSCSSCTTRTSHSLHTTSSTYKCTCASLCVASLVQLVRASIRACTRVMLESYSYEPRTSLYKALYKLVEACVYLVQLVRATRPRSACVSSNELLLLQYERRPSKHDRPVRGQLLLASLKGVHV